MQHLDGLVEELIEMLVEYVMEHGRYLPLPVGSDILTVTTFEVYREPVGEPGARVRVGIATTRLIRAILTMAVEERGIAPVLRDMDRVLVGRNLWSRAAQVTRFYADGLVEGRKTIPVPRRIDRAWDRLLSHLSALNSHSERMAFLVEGVASLLDLYQDWPIVLDLDNEVSVIARADTRMVQVFADVIVAAEWPQTAREATVATIQHHLSLEEDYEAWLHRALMAFSGEKLLAALELLAGRSS